MENKKSEINWEELESGGKFKPNLKIKTEHGDIVYSHAPDAQETYDKYLAHSKGMPMPCKDLEEGMIYEANIIKKGETHWEASIGDAQSIFIDYQKELPFLESIGFDPEGIGIGTEVTVFVTRAKNGHHLGSIEKGYKKKLKKELHASIKKKENAYLATITGANTGGFIVKVSGVECFMPGSLAAANKIPDEQFESMVGKEVYVMVENYLKQSDMFIVSHKAYIKHILPTEVKKLDFAKEYTGRVTGTAPFGCFVEWDDENGMTLFTGLIHTSEMDGDLLADLKKTKPGTEVKFWINNVKDPNRLILSQKGPEKDRAKYQEFKDEWEDEVFDGAMVKDIKPFGTFIEMGEITGMLPAREWKKIDHMEEGDGVSVYVKRVDVDDKKIYLKTVND